VILARERDSAREAEGECCWASPLDTFKKEKLMACVDFLLLVVIPIVSLCLVHRAVPRVAGEEQFGAGDLTPRLFFVASGSHVELQGLVH
jgi:hypothetical protein